MSRADDLQAAWDARRQEAYGDNATLLAAIPDLLAVVRAAQEAAILTYDPRRTDAENDEYQRRAKRLRLALAAFEEGGK